MKQIHLNKVISIISIFLLAFLSSNALIYQFTLSKFSIYGFLLTIPTFIIYLSIYLVVSNTDDQLYF